MTLDRGDLWTYLRDNWDIHYITGEACGVGIRARVDVGPRGQQLLNEFFGGMTLTYVGWNNPSWKTMMFPRDLLESLAVWGLLHEHDAVVRVISDDERSVSPKYITYSQEEFEKTRDARTFQKWRNLGWRVDVWRKTGTAMGGLQNRHEFSGRVL